MPNGPMGECNLTKTFRAIGKKANWLDPLIFKIGSTMPNSLINPSSTNVPPMQKPGSWFLLAKYLKNTCGRVTF